MSRALRQAAEAKGVRFEFGKALASVEHRQSDVRACFGDGSVATGRCVIGADGIHSRTRACALPDAAGPTYTGIINLGGIVQTDLPDTGAAMRMIFGRRGFFGYAVRPGGETWWFSNFHQREEPVDRRSTTLSAEDLRQRLLDLHRDDPPEVARIIEAVSGHVGVYPIYDMPSLPIWRRGAVCLIGDAAHAIGPHAGQGASLALEDAFVIAKCLRDIPDVAAAFAMFHQTRRPRVEPIIRQSRRTAQQKAPHGRVGRALRDLILPMFLRKSAQSAQGLYRYPLVWEDRVSPT